MFQRVHVLFSLALGLVYKWTRDPTLLQCGTKSTNGKLNGKKLWPHVHFLRNPYKGNSIKKYFENRQKIKVM